MGQRCSERHEFVKAQDAPWGEAAAFGAEEKPATHTLRVWRTIFVVALLVSACSDDHGDRVPDTELYGAAAAALAGDQVHGETVWFYETEAMTPVVQGEIEFALSGRTVLFGPDWSEITACLPEGDLPVALTIQEAVINGASAEIEVSYDNPISAGDGTVIASLEEGSWVVDEIIYGPHGDKALEDC